MPIATRPDWDSGAPIVGVGLPPLAPFATAEQPPRLIRTGEFPTLGNDTPDAIRLGRFFDHANGKVTGRMVYSEERNLLIFGPNGAGKMARLLAPTLLQCRERSMFVVDPSGELAAITAPHRRRLGRVIIINPFGVLTDVKGYEDLESSGFNPLARLDPRSKSFNADAALLADALVTVEGYDPHWTKSARALIAALIMFTVMEARQMLTPAMKETCSEGSIFIGNRTTPTIARVRELLSLASSEANAANGYQASGIPVLALALMRSGIAGLRNKAAQFTEWNREIQSIASAAKIQTEAFDDDEISEDLSRDGFDFTEMKERPVTVYLILPPEMMERHAKWLRLVISSAIQSLMRPRRAGEPRVLFILDEFAALGHLQIVETVWPLVRKYGLQILPVFQDLTQLKQLYGQRWQTFVGMAGVVTCFAPNDLETADWIAERAGKTTRVVINRGTSESTGTSESFGQSGGSSSGAQGGSASSGWNSGTSYNSNKSTSTNYNDTQVPLIHRHSLFGLYAGATINFIAGLSDAVPGYAPAYWHIRECAERARRNPYYANG